jgi:hypothetical protein
MIIPKRTVPVIVGLLILCFSGSLFAQSVFSAQGIGEVRPVPNARFQGMGGAGIAFRDSLELSIVNPASPATISQTRLAISGGYQWIRVEDNLASDSRDFAGFDGIAIAIPFYNKWTFSAGLDPFTVARSTWSWNREYQGNAYLEDFRVSGGISRGLFGISFPVRKHLFLGGGARILFGDIDQVLTLNFVSSTFRDAQYTRRLHTTAVGVTAGAAWEFHRNWSIGALYWAKERGDGSVDLSYFDSDSVHTTNGTVEFPATLGAGLSGSIAPRIKISSDVMWTQWKDSKVMVGSNVPDSLSDTWKISAGAEYQPLFAPLASFFNQLYYRIGFSTENHYIKNSAGQSPRTSLITAGLGIPLKEAGRRLDIAAYWGIRGNIADFGAKETLFGLSLTLETSEKWFVRRK